MPKTQFIPKKVNFCCLFQIKNPRTSKKLTTQHVFWFFIILFFCVHLCFPSFNFAVSAATVSFIYLFFFWKTGRGKGPGFFVETTKPNGLKDKTVKMAQQVLIEMRKLPRTTTGSTKNHCFITTAWVTLLQAFAFTVIMVMDNNG